MSDTFLLLLVGVKFEKSILYSVFEGFSFES